MALSAWHTCIRSQTPSRSTSRAFDDSARAARNNPDCERNIGALIGTWRERSSPVVFVRHDGLEEESPYDTLGREHPGNAFKPVLEGEPDLLVTKQVNSAFHGSPDLEAWLRANGVDAITVCGIQTQMCCETTARVGANLGFELTFAIDATHTFDLPAYGGGPCAPTRWRVSPPRTSIPSSGALPPRPS